MSRTNVQLLVIDPQVDFMDSPGSALPVTGANEDMRRLAAMLGRVGNKINDIHVTLDSHRIIDIAHPALWVDQDGNHPNPFTIITEDDLKMKVFYPRNSQMKLPDFEGRTLGEYVEWYVGQLTVGGNYPLMIWPPHCLIGSPGHSIQPELLAALTEWETKRFASVDFVTKGTNVWTEHYGGLQAEVPMASDPSSGLNTQLLKVLGTADIVVVAGEALSHCVKATVTQIADNIGEEHIRKFHILTDCSSSVDPVLDPASGDVLVDFPQIAQDWLKEMEQRGMTLTTSEEFLK